jgi:alginate O-acetyltransferase complex protein AlgI
VQLVLTQIFEHLHPEIFTQLVLGYKNVFIWMLLAMMLHFIPFAWHSKSVLVMSKLPLPLQSVIMVLVLYFVAQVQSSDIQPFIYFQF